MRAVLSLDYNEMVEWRRVVGLVRHRVSAVKAANDYDAMRLGEEVQTLRRMEGLIESALNLARIEAAKVGQ